MNILCLLTTNLTDFEVTELIVITKPDSVSHIKCGLFALMPVNHLHMVMNKTKNPLVINIAKV